MMDFKIIILSSVLVIVSYSDVCAHMLYSDAEMVAYHMDRGYGAAAYGNPAKAPASEAAEPRYAGRRPPRAKRAAPADEPSNQIAPGAVQPGRAYAELYRGKRGAYIYVPAIYPAITEEAIAPGAAGSVYGYAELYRGKRGAPHEEVDAIARGVAELYRGKRGAPHEEVETSSAETERGFYAELYRGKRGALAKSAAPESDTESRRSYASQDGYRRTPEKRRPTETYREKREAWYGYGYAPESVAAEPGSSAPRAKRAAPNQDGAPASERGEHQYGIAPISRLLVAPTSPGRQGRRKRSLEVSPIGRRLEVAPIGRRKRELDFENRYGKTCFGLLCSSYPGYPVVEIGRRKRYAAVVPGLPWHGGYGNINTDCYGDGCYYG